MAKRRKKSKIKYPSWGSDVRRKKYAEDSEHRDNALTSARGYYRRQHDVAVPETRAAIRRMPKVGVTRKVFMGVDVKRLKTYTLSELADLVGRSVDVLRRWTGKMMLPVPTLRCVDKDGGQMVYNGREVRAILHVLADHFEETVYYRQSHGETKARLYAVVNRVRNKE